MTAEWAVKRINAGVNEVLSSAMGQAILGIKPRDRIRWDVGNADDFQMQMGWVRKKHTGLSSSAAASSYIHLYDMDLYLDRKCFCMLMDTVERQPLVEGNKKVFASKRDNS